MPGRAPGGSFGEPDSPVFPVHSPIGPDRPEFGAGSADEPNPTGRPIGQVMRRRVAVQLRILVAEIIQYSVPSSEGCERKVAIPTPHSI